ncbi:MAG: PD40 domain-containing protein [Planctomycetes bacterium]|nr:PD40 domain-containing protein [Planctomycetota bacterium]
MARIAPSAQLKSRGLSTFVISLLAAALTQPAIAQSTTRASLAPGDAEISGGARLGGTQNCISDDGRFVVFATDDDGVVTGDTNHASDVFLRDLWLNETFLVSHDGNGSPGDDYSWQAALSADGSTVVFASAATNLVPPDKNSSVDIFAWDRLTDTLSRISDSYTGTRSHGRSEAPSVSSDGQLIAFSSWAFDLVPSDTNGEPDIFVHDRSTGTTTRVSLTESGVEADRYRICTLPTISRDGGTVCFVTDADLVAGDTNNLHIYAVDRATASIELIDVTESGLPVPYAELKPAFMSGDGRFVAFFDRHGVILDGDIDQFGGAYLRDRLLDVTEFLSVDSEGNGIDSEFGSWVHSISADGRFVAFDGYGPAYGYDSLEWTCMVRDREFGFTLPIPFGDDDVLSDQPTSGVSLSMDGRFYAFTSADDSLVSNDTNHSTDVFVRERIFDVAKVVEYGNGTTGRLGIPSFALNDLPMLGKDLTLTIGNSSGLWTVAALLVGSASDDLPLYGGSLLVVPDFASALPLAPGSNVLDFCVPVDESLVGISLFTQALLLDPWACDGVAMTAGIEVAPGY